MQTAFVSVFHRMIASVIAATALVTGCAGPGEETVELAPGVVVFTDITREAGITFVHATGFDGRYWFPEIVGPGCAVVDVDGDDRLDLYFVNGGSLTPRDDGSLPPHPANALYRNEGDGRFTDVTERAGVAGDHYGQGCAVGDFDGDGDPDLYLTNVGPNQLFRNDGDGTFSELSAAAGVADPSWSTSAAFADLDGDGDLDLFVTNYCIWSQGGQVPCRSPKGEPDYCKPSAYEPAGDVYYRNRGDGTFEEATRAAGFNVAYGHGLGVGVADFDEDGDPDVYVANDGDANNLWINQGDGTFVDDAALAGAALNALGNAEASMGVTIADLDTDGDWDLFLTHLTRETNTLYVNDGRGFFEDVTQVRGLGAESMPFTGFGTLFFDADLDTDLDLFVANGAVIKGDSQDRSDWPYAQRDQFFVNEGDRFRELTVAEAPWLAAEAVGRGAAFGDLDEDGDIDIVVANAGGAPRVLRNDSPRGDRRYLGIELEDAGGNRFGIGAVVTVAAATGHWQRQRLARDGSFASANEGRVLFGLPAATERAEVGVRWPGGVEEVWSIDDLDRDVRLRRGSGKADSVPSPGARARPLRSTAERGGAGGIRAEGIPSLPALDQVDAAVAQRVRDAHTALARSPESAAAWKGYGLSLYADANAYERAAAALARAVELDPTDERSHYLLALSARQLGDLEAARIHLEQTIALADYMPARLRLAELDADDRRLEEAEAQYRAVLAAEPDNSYALEGLGRVQRLSGNARAAVDNLRMAVELAPRSRKARHELGLAWREMGDLERAREHLAAAQELAELPMGDPWLAELVAGRGGDAALLTGAHQARQAGDLNRAAQLYAEYVKKRPDDAVGWANLAAISRDLGLGGDALAAAERALAIDDRRAETWALKGALLVEKGEPEAALEAYEQAVAINPGLAQAWLERGLVLSARGRPAAAAAALERYVELRPSDPLGFLKLAEAQLAARAYDQAGDSLEQVLRMDPDNAVAHYRAAGLALARQDADGAIRHFGGAVASRPGWAEAHYGLALAYRMAGEPDRALEEAERAAALKPEMERIQLLLNELRGE